MAKAKRKATTDAVEILHAAIMQENQNGLLL